MFYDVYISLCKRDGKKPSPVAVELGLRTSNVAQWKKGSTPRPEVLKKVAAYFNVPISYLLETDDKGIKNPPAVSDEGNKKELLIKYINHMNQDQLDQAGAFLKWLLSNPEK